MNASDLPANRFCSVARALEVLGQKWNLLILREAFLGRTRFGEFERIGIPVATLGQRLTDLVEAGLLERRPYREGTGRARDEYVLTASARDVILVLASLSAWSDEHLPLPAGAAMVYVERSTGRPVELRFIDDEGSEVRPEDVTVARGPVFAAAVASSQAFDG